MTMIVTILLGTGVLLIVSAIEDKPLKETFQDIISNKSNSQQEATEAPSMPPTRHYPVRF